ncbi:MAG: winged helix-turn-helix domain-containing protein [Desulfomonile sp.]|nr:winged helix-turn-helix domain-containing protein [Desulfomonile sp.]
MEELDQEYQVARGRKDFDLTQRIQGLLLVNQGLAERWAAQILGVGRRNLQDWIFRYRRGGPGALVKGPYPGRKPKLTEAQRAQLDHIIEQGPESVGVDTGVWTAPLVAGLVKKLFGMRYHPDHMRRILRRLRFSVQLPTRELSRADPEEQAKWLDHELQEIKKVDRSVGCSSTRTKPHSAKPDRCIEHGPERVGAPRSRAFLVAKAQKSWGGTGWRKAGPAFPIRREIQHRHLCSVHRAIAPFLQRDKDSPGG